MLKHPSLMHLIDIESLSAETINALLAAANAILKGHAVKISQNIAENTPVATLFYENSTRTRFSFHLAASRLKMTCLDFTREGSSASKGESLQDTAATLVAMGAKILILRHPEAHSAEQLKEIVGDKASIINAGDGAHAHPTQALLDMLTIQHHKKKFNDLRVAIIGDVLYSRVARSQICALTKLGVKAIHVIAPTVLLPQDIHRWPVVLYDDIAAGLKEVDVIICLRIQKERMPSDLFPDVVAYHEQYGLTQERLLLAKPDAIVMHPGPMNRGVEIESSVADGKQSVILEQVHNGVALRMAVLSAIAEERCQ
ncbi:MAG: aspartate carbamoyltransferase [Gammaproteobacteria bacterium]|nr:aspartate carbamoyltransferase [Gammaproteobacteria bacterium]